MSYCRKKKRKMLQLLSEKNDNDSSDVPSKISKTSDVDKQSQKKVHFEEEPESENASEEDGSDIVQNSNDDNVDGDDFDDNDNKEEEITLPHKEKSKRSICYVCR